MSRPSPFEPEDVWRPTRGDLARLLNWMEQLETASTQPQPFIGKKKTREQDELFEKYRRWLNNKEQAHREASAVHDEDALPPPTETPPSSETHTPPSHYPEFRKVAALIYDYRGLEVLTRTLDLSAVTWDSFHHARALSPFSGPLGTASLEVSQISPYFSLTKQALLAGAKADSEWILFLESGCSLSETAAAAFQESLLENPQANLVLLRVHRDGKEAPPQKLYHDQLLRQFAHPQHLPALFVRTSYLAQHSRLPDEQLHHLSFWSLCLSQLEEDPRGLIATHQVGAHMDVHDYQLSQHNRNWLTQEGKQDLSELRESLAEWGSLYHDLIGRIASRHRSHLQDQLAYFLSTSATKVLR